MGHTVVMLLVILLMLVGLAGIVLPLLPGIALIFIGIAVYGWYEGFQIITPQYLAIMGALTILAMLVDYLAASLGAKYSGSTRAGVWGAFIGMVIGLFILPPAGVLIFPWVGAMLGEYISVNDAEKAVKAGFGTVIGLFSGMIFKLVLGLIMVVSFLIRVI